MLARCRLYPGWMPGRSPPDDAFAIRNDEQYQPVGMLGDQRVLVTDSAGEGFLPCHASHSLDGTHRGVGRVVVVVHGALRDSERYLACAAAAAPPSGARTLMVAPQFLADVDVAAHGDGRGTLHWDVEGWKGGQPAIGPSALSSFSAMDSLLLRLTRPGWLAGRGAPAVVIVGNSAGGQFVNRYAAVGRAPQILAERGIGVRFIIANPSTYLYFSRQRPVAVPDPSRVNRWRYGFENAPAYVTIGPRQGLRRYLARDVTTILGALDNDGAALLLEVSPPAMAQGVNRLERGINYHAHVRALARAAGITMGHRLIQLAGVGHAAGDVLSAPQTREAMFG
jgi:hypothetical protein